MTFLLKPARPARLMAFASFLAFSPGAPIAAHAQTASQVTRDSYAPPVVRQVGGGLDLPQTTGFDAPAGAEQLSVTPSGLLIEGTPPSGSADLIRETARIEATLSGKRVSGADLFAAARALEVAYARAGYLLVRVTLPPQTIADGRPLRLVVTDGYVGAVDVSALPDPVRRRIKALLAPLIGERGLTRRALERRLLMAGDTPGILLTSTLKAGDTPGATTIVINGRYDPLTASFLLDNGLSKNMGTYAATFGLDFNSLFGLGEVTYLRLSGYPGFSDANLFSDDPRNRQIIAGATLPLGTDGFWLNMEGVDSRTHPTSDLGYTMRDRYQRLSTKLGYNWLRSRQANTASILGFDIADERQTILLGNISQEFSSDRLRVLRLTQTADFLTEQGGAFSGSITASFGLDAFGARNATAALPLSRTSAEPDFRKLEVSGRYTHAFLDDRLQLSLSGKAQTSFGAALAASEQMGLGGVDGLSAYTSGAIEADSGAVLRAELSFPARLELLQATPAIGSVMMPYVFAGAGIARLEAPSAMEARITHAAAFGVGVRFGLSRQASQSTMTLGLEYAHGAASNLEDEDRFRLKLIARF